MADKTDQTARQDDSATNRPTHRVVFRRKLRNGYGQSVEIGGAWQNSRGGISFPFAGGSVTVWPVTDREGNDKAEA